MLVTRRNEILIQQIIKPHQLFEVADFVTSPEQSDGRQNIMKHKKPDP